MAAAVGLAALAASCSSGGGGGTTPSTGAPRVAPKVEERTLTVDGEERHYRLFTPEGLDRHAGLALVLALHGALNSAESMVQATQLDGAATDHGFMVAYPSARNEVWNGGFCCTQGRGSMGPDVEFLGRLIDDVGTVRNLDARRVYAVGVSAGGVMAYRLACNLAERLAGIGAVAAAMLLDDCAPSRPVPVAILHGTADPIVPFAGGRVQGGAVLPAPSTRAIAERWASLDGCPAPPTTEVAGTVTTSTWAGCEGGSSVRLVVVADGGHNWFAKDFDLPDGAVDATTDLLRFFGLAPPPGPDAPDAPAGPVSSVPTANADLGPPPS